METRDRDKFRGKILSVRNGAENDEIEIMVDDSDERITALMDSAETKRLGLEAGKEVFAVIKESQIILLTNQETEMKLQKFWEDVR